jgi:hypothetical protein
LAAIALFTNTVYYFIDKKISKAILSWISLKKW